MITWAKINKIRLWEPLEIQTIQPEKNMKYATEFGHAGYMLPIQINYMVIHHTLTYWGIIPLLINPIHITYCWPLTSVGNWLVVVDSNGPLPDVFKFSGRIWKLNGILHCIFDHNWMNIICNSIQY